MKLRESTRNEAIMPRDSVLTPVSPRFFVPAIAIYEPITASRIYRKYPNAFVMGIIEVAWPFAFAALCSHSVLRCFISFLDCSSWQKTFMTF